MTPFQQCSLGALVAMTGILLVAASVQAPAALTSAPRVAVEADVVTDAGGAGSPAGGGVHARPFRRQTVHALTETFTGLDYELASVVSGKAEVPRLFLVSLPVDMEEIRQAEARKRLFFKAVLPLVLQVNEEIRADRRRLWDLRYSLRAGEKLDAVDRLWLMVAADRYRVDAEDLAALARRMDVIPPSLALAQAAVESGWGTSRFAREGNALFGQWTFSASGDLVPLRRDPGKTHRVRAFDNLLDSVRAYMRNLNTHPTYRAFRQARSKMRREGAPLNGSRLATRLDHYAEQGVAYVAIIRATIENNDLGRFDDARLRYPTPAPRPSA
jgi:Bax protein